MCGNVVVRVTHMQCNCDDNDARAEMLAELLHMCKNVVMRVTVGREWTNDGPCQAPSTFMTCLYPRQHIADFSKAKEKQIYKFCSVKMHQPSGIGSDTQCCRAGRCMELLDLVRCIRSPDQAGKASAGALQTLYRWNWHYATHTTFMTTLVWQHWAKSKPTSCAGITSKLNKQ